MPERVKMKIHEIEPGWLIIHFDGPKPKVHQRYHYLDKALHDWLAERPGRALVRVAPIEHFGQLLGLHAWHGDLRGSRKMEIKMSKVLVHDHGKEYLEALVAEIGALLQNEPNQDQMLAVVNRRGIATLIQPGHEQGMMMPLERFLSGADAKTRERVKQFLDEHRGSLFAIPVMPTFQTPPLED